MTDDQQQQNDIMQEQIVADEWFDSLQHKEQDYTEWVAQNPTQGQ